MTAYQKILIVELVITAAFYAVAAYHWLTPREWAWLDEEQLHDVTFAGTVWCAFLVYDCWKRRKEKRHE